MGRDLCGGTPRTLESERYESTKTAQILVGDAHRECIDRSEPWILPRRLRWPQAPEECLVGSPSKEDVSGTNGLPHKSINDQNSFPRVRLHFIAHTSAIFQCDDS